jgi:hypothetical protein
LDSADAQFCCIIDNGPVGSIWARDEAQDGVHVHDGATAQWHKKLLALDWNVWERVADNSVECLQMVRPWAPMPSDGILAVPALVVTAGCFHNPLWVDHP